MSRYEEFFGILTAFIAWLWGTMLRQQNNEKLSSDSNFPTFSNSTNSQCNASQVDSANNSNEAQQTARQGSINSSPMLRQQNNEKPSLSYGNSPTISGVTNSQFSANQVASATGSTFSPSFTWSGPDSRSPEAQNQPDKKHKG